MISDFDLAYHLDGRVLLRVYVRWLRRLQPAWEDLNPDDPSFGRCVEAIAVYAEGTGPRPPVWGVPEQPSDIDDVLLAVLDEIDYPWGVMESIWPIASAFGADLYRDVCAELWPYDPTAAADAARLCATWTGTIQDLITTITTVTTITASTGAAPRP